MNWQERLKQAETVDARLALAKEDEADPELLRLFIQADSEPSIIIAAAIHHNCPLDMLALAAERSGWRTDLLQEHRKQTLLKMLHQN